MEKEQIQGRRKSRKGMHYQLLFRFLKLMNGRFSYEDGLKLDEIAKAIYDSDDPATKQRARALISRARKFLRVYGLDLYSTIGRNGYRYHILAKPEDYKKVVEDSIREEIVRNVIAPVIRQAEEVEREVVRAVSVGTPSIAIFDAIKYVDSLAELLIKGNDEATMDWIRQLVDSVGRGKLGNEVPVIRRVGRTLIKMADYIEGEGL